METLYWSSISLAKKIITMVDITFPCDRIFCAMGSKLMTAEQSTFMIDLHQVGMMLRYIRKDSVKVFFFSLDEHSSKLVEKYFPFNYL